MTLDLDDDLHAIWDEIRGLEPWPIRAFVRSERRVLSVGAPKDQRKIFWQQLQAQLGSNELVRQTERPMAMRFPTTAVRDLLFDFLENWMEKHGEGVSPILEFMEALIEASQSSEIHVRAWPLDPLARHLKAIRHRHPLELEFAAFTLVNWVHGETAKWTSKELEFLGIVPTLWEREKSARPDVASRIFRMVLLGSWFGIVPRSFLVVDDLDQLLRSPFRTTEFCRREAESLDTLLTELERWPRSTVQAVLGWSGHEEDAKLLRGLHEPLFQKVHAFRVPLGNVTHA